MATAKDLLQSADWKSEKHVPVIEAPDSVKKTEAVSVSVSVGKQIAHPNTSAHHIAWINVLFQPEGEKFPYELGRFEFSAHGASTQGADTSAVYTQPAVSLTFKTEKSGVLFAVSYCNIHGIWESAKSIQAV
jgi:superoxide reductase